MISRNVDISLTVAASLQAPTMFTIAQDLTRMQIETDVDVDVDVEPTEKDSRHVLIKEYPIHVFC